MFPESERRRPVFAGIGNGIRRHVARSRPIENAVGERRYMTRVAGARRQAPGQRTPDTLNYTGKRSIKGP